MFEAPTGPLYAQDKSPADSHPGIVIGDCECKIARGWSVDFHMSLPLQFLSSVIGVHILYGCKHPTSATDWVSPESKLGQPDNNGFLDWEEK